jgi:transposase-like protein
MLVELLVVEQRYLAVREALDSGATITDIARRYGVDRRTVHRWLVRYAAGGLGALADPELQARSLPPPDLARRGGQDRGPSKVQPRVGAPHHPEQAPP